MQTSFVAIVVGALLLLVSDLALAGTHTVSSIEELMVVANEDGHAITMTPGTYRVNDYLTPERIAQMALVIEPVDGVVPKRPPMPVLTFGGSDNTFDFSGVEWVVDTEVYDLSLIHI